MKLTRRNIAAGYAAWPDALWLWSLSLLTVLAVGLVLSGIESPVRVVAVLAFMLGAPGVALARAIGIEDPASTLAVGIAASIATNIVLAGSLLYAGIWEPSGVLLALAAVTILLIVIAAAREQEPEAEAATP
jgi:hypothetical protein